MGTNHISDLANIQIIPDTNPKATNIFGLT
jgi:hypothetical protein